MIIKDILLHLDAGDACALRTGAAVALAGRYAAHLTGLYIIPQVYLPAHPGMLHTAELIQRLEKVEQTRAEKAEAAFRQATAQLAAAAEWRCEQYQDAETFNRYARNVDLIVTGLAGDGRPGIAGGGFTEQAVLASGCPVMIIPPGYAGGSPGKHILIAWNGSREAIRAVHDALPLLEKAAEVELLTLAPPAGAGVSASEICTHLARHRIRVKAETTTASEAEAGVALLAHATHNHADLIVMGAYGHWRWSEWLLGGASRHLLQHTTVPLLMSH